MKIDHGYYKSSRDMFVIKMTTIKKYLNTTIIFFNNWAYWEALMFTFNY